MKAQANRTTFGNYNRMLCASRLLNAHTHTHTHTHTHPGHYHAITTVSVSLIYSPFALAKRQRNDYTVFESLPPMSNTPMLNLHTVPLMLNVKQASCEYQFLKSFGKARQGNEPQSTDCKQNPLTITPSLLPLHHHCPITRCRTRMPQCTNFDK